VVNTKADFIGGRALLSSSQALLPVLEDMAAGPGDSATAWSELGSTVCAGVGLGGSARVIPHVAGFGR
jgi:hypothetical protein